MKLVICEDERPSRELLENLIGAWGMDHGEQVQLLCYEQGDEMRFKIEEWQDADGVILDIELGAKLNGMELARWIRSLDEKLPILFVTGYERYVFEGYEVGALSYLMKPVNQQKLNQALTKMLTSVSTRDQILVTDQKDETTKLYLHEIRTIESRGHYVMITTKSEQQKIRKSMNEMAGMLNQGDFVSPHRSYLVNIAHISRIDKQWIYVDDGQQIPIARGRWTMVNQAYLDYYRKVL